MLDSEQPGYQQGLVRVLVVDDHPMVRTGIRKMINRTSDLLVVGEAADGFEALRLVEKLKPEVLILDIEMPGMSGVDVARNLNSSSDPVHILIHSNYGDKEYVLALIELGICGYVIKGDDSDWLLDAIRSVARGSGNWFSPKVRAYLPTKN